MTAGTICLLGAALATCCGRAPRDYVVVARPEPVEAGVAWTRSLRAPFRAEDFPKLAIELESRARSPAAVHITLAWERRDVPWGNAHGHAEWDLKVSTHGPTRILLAASTQASEPCFDCFHGAIAAVDLRLRSDAPVTIRRAALTHGSLLQDLWTRATATHRLHPNTLLIAIALAAWPVARRIDRRRGSLPALIVGLWALGALWAMRAPLLDTIGRGWALSPAAARRVVLSRPDPTHLTEISSLVERDIPVGSALEVDVLDANALTTFYAGFLLPLRPLVGRQSEPHRPERTFALVADPSLLSHEPARAESPQWRGLDSEHPLVCLIRAGAGAPREVLGLRLAAPGLSRPLAVEARRPGSRRAATRGLRLPSSEWCLFEKPVQMCAGAALLLKISSEMTEGARVALVSDSESGIPRLDADLLFPPPGTTTVKLLPPHGGLFERGPGKACTP